MTDVQDPTLGELVIANPSAAQVLERFGLDYCCRGNRSLADACAEAGLDAGAVTAALDDSGADHVDLDEATWLTFDPPALAEFIVATHHRFLWDELPALEALADKVLTAHGTRHPELAEVRALVSELRADLEPHMMKEERVLFPAIAAAAEGKRDFPFGSLANPIRMMTLEHDRAGDLLARLRAVTDQYAPPADGCASYRSLYGRLAALELDTHVHIHKENHVLFPAALRLADT